MAAPPAAGALSAHASSPLGLQQPQPQSWPQPQPSAQLQHAVAYVYCGPGAGLRSVLSTVRSLREALPDVEVRCGKGLGREGREAEASTVSTAKRRGASLAPAATLEGRQPGCGHQTTPTTARVP